MAMPFPITVTAAQVGTYFVGQYYQVLQEQPDFVHQFYSDASTVVRVDGHTRETATAMIQIHTLIMSLKFTGIEVKTAHSLESWNGGVLVMVSGSLQIKDYNRRRKFMQTFFLAPQQKGFFVLNDIFHFIEEELIHHHPAVLLAQSNLDTKLNAPTSITEPVSSYLLGGDVQAREFMKPAEVVDNGPMDNYSFPEQRLQQVPDSEHIVVDNIAEDSNGSLQMTVNTIQDHLPASSDETIGEPQKHTYASILRVAKGISTPSVAPQPSANKNMPSEWDHAPQTSTQQPTVSSNAYERSGVETLEDAPVTEDEDEIKSVYVRNLPPTVSASEIEEQFKNFGRISPDSVAIRSRKDVGVCYAFVEFEDSSGVYNAVKAGSVQIAGRQVYIEERRPNSNIPSRGGRRGRGRGIYQTEAPRGRFVARNYGRASGYDSGDWEYNRPRANGFYRPNPRQERGFSGHQVSRNGQNPADST
ncbi:Nuclear transport factor 2 family protein with RNA binding domain isoform 2 [Quillaja saponaria]|uniref:Nuclear transport factor 2 family protein with RNA binding domain isoform 2 n=1 Tax=Quillaja saponaria TaxID=32244 RepID=A0AAD7QE06_QUISA|nr:Nuclear transport factor 2 family protein with RNA binding domain isoform 2 [Quillaja saponaria]